MLLLHRSGPLKESGRCRAGSDLGFRIAKLRWPGTWFGQRLPLFGRHTRRTNHQRHQKTSSNVGLVLWFARWMLALYHRFLRTCMQNSHSGVFFLCFNTCFFLNVLDKFRWSIHWRSCRTPSDDPKWHFNSIRRIRSHEQQKLMRSNWKPLSTSQYIQYITLVLL